jgi:hypothetical protein
MGEFLHKYNTDDVHSRAVIVGIINLLNDKIFYENILGDNSIDTVYVPFFYNMGGDERFLQDYFLNWNDCIHPKFDCGEFTGNFADGNYDVIPRGIVTLTSKTIDTGKMTHRFVRGNYVKEVNGELQTFSAFLNSIPINMAFEVTIETDTYLDAFKIEQALVETFYKNQVFSVTYKGFRIPCQGGFSEDYGLEKTFEFTYQADAKTTLKFNIEVETYFPVLDRTTEFSNAKRIAGFNTIDISSEDYNKPRFTFNSPVPNEKYFSSGELPIAWGNTGPIRRVNLYYRLVGETEWTLIARNLNNVGTYDWKIPFFDINGTPIANEGHRSVVVSETGRDSRVRAIIDALGSVDKIVVLDQGYGYTSTDLIEVNLFPLPPTIPPTFVAPIIQATISSGSVFSANIVDGGSGFTPSPITKLEVKIEDSNNESNYLVLSDIAKFTGDIDSSTINNLITNVNPTVTTLLETYPLVGQRVTGIGIPFGSTIVGFSEALNRIEVSSNVTTTKNNNDFTLSASNGILYIQ